MWRRSIEYKIGEMLGEGGQGQVFKALRQDPASGLSQTVAIKILHSEIAVDIWKREFESLARVRSPYCVQVFAFERLNRRPALILEYVDGVSLASLGKSCWLSENEIQEILAQCERAILDLYSYGLFHGDLSPHNILIDRQGQLRLLDFGWANCAEESARLTPEFTSPERLAGEKASFASDIFSLGRLEQFLRGQSPGPDPESSYLCFEPAKRSLRGVFPTKENQLLLSQRVQTYQERKQFASSARTATCTQTNTRRERSAARLILTIVTALLPLVMPTAGMSSLPTARMVLQIRTDRWHYFHLNGSPLGYAPVSIPVESDRSYRLDWVSAEGHGTKILKMTAKTNLLLQDRDFLH